MTKTLKHQRDNARALLLEPTGYALKHGDVIFTDISRVSSSGMTRDIRLFIIRDNDLINITYYAAQALGDPVRDDKYGRRVIKVHGAGMDMAFHVVNNLSYALFNDGYALTKRDI